MSRAEGESESDNVITWGYVAYLELAEPLFPLVSLFLAECKLYEFLIAVLSRGKWNHVLLHIAEVVTSVGVAACSKTLSCSPMNGMQTEK